MLPFEHYDDVKIGIRPSSCLGYESVFHDVNVGIGGATQPWCARKKKHVSSPEDRVLVDFKIVGQGQCKHPWTPTGDASYFGMGTDSCQRYMEGCALYKKFKDLDDRQPIVTDLEFHGANRAACKTPGFVPVGDARAGCGGNFHNFCIKKTTKYDPMLKFCGNNMSDATCRKYADEGGAVWDVAVANHCALHPSDPYCACSPAAVEAEVAKFTNLTEEQKSALKSRPECYNATCANQGYKNQQQRRNQASGCPPLTLCSQSTTTDGGSNIVQGNIQMQTCGTAEPSSPQQPPKKEKNTMLIMFLLIVLAILVGYVMWPSKEVDGGGFPVHESVPW